MGEGKKKEPTKVDLIKAKIDGIKELIGEKGNAIYDMYHSRSPKKDAIREWAKNLELLVNLGEADYKTHEIGGIIRKELKAIGAEHAVHWATHILPFKYKNRELSHGTEDTGDEKGCLENSQNSSSILLAADCKKINANYILRLSRSAMLLNKFNKQLKSKLPFEPEFDELELEEHFLIWDAINQRLEDILDGRDKVSYSTQHLFFFAATTETLNHIYAKYIENIKDFASITSKQSGKILRGEIPKIIPLMDPKTRREALAAGFYGQLCTECGSWRTVYKYHNEGEASDDDRTSKPGGKDVFCYACHWWMKPKTVKLEYKPKI